MIVNNIRNTTVVMNTVNKQARPQEQAWQQQLLQLFTEYINNMPMKELSRELRSFFLLHVSGLRNIPSGFENHVLKMLVILEMLDEAEDAAS